MSAWSRAPGTRPAGIARLGFAAVAALALGLITAGVFAQRDYAVLPPDVPATSLLPLTIDGTEAETKAELDHLVRHQRVGDVLRLGDGREITLRPELEGSLLVVTLLSALAFWAVCVFALAPRIRKPGIGDLTVSLLLGALVIAIGGTSVPHGAVVAGLSIVYLLAASFMGPFFVRFSLAFPRPLPGARTSRTFGTVLLVLGTGIALWTSIGWAHAVNAPGVSGVAIERASKNALYLLLATCLVLACAFLYRSSRTARLDRERRQAKWILWGMAIGTAPYVLFRALPRVLIGAEPPWPPAVDRAIELTIPLAFAVAVVRERFLDIDLVIRRSVLYTLLALAGAALFFGTALLLADVVFRGLDLPEPWSPWAWAVAGALTGLLFQPGRRFIGRGVDRTIFRLRHTHDEALADLEQDLHRVRSQAEAAGQLASFLDEALEPKASLALVRDGEAWERAGTLALDASPLLEALAEETALWAVPDATGAPEVEHADFPAAAAKAGARLVQPVRAGGELLGLLVVAERRTERHYLPEDLEALVGAAAAAAGGLERLALVQRAAEEATERRALAEVSRQKAEFFARLAHDLRTPVTAVQWSTRNLLDGLPGPLNDRQQRYLEGVGAAAGQLARLVDNLVDLGRLDLSPPRHPAEAVDLAAVVREAASALESVAHERHARIRLDLSAEAPPVRGRKEAAFQIVINLVDNALKYTTPETEVEVAVRGAREGRQVVLTVRDHGPGLPEDHEGLFDLFAQGPESPHAKTRGFGIGLHIVRTWAESMGGSVAAENAPDGGARFTCRLPCWREEGDE